MSDQFKKTRKRALRGMREYSGTVVLEPVSMGSKSERMAVQLDTGSEKLQLRRLGIQRYRDKELESLVGKNVTCHGIERGGRLYLEDFESD